MSDLSNTPDAVSPEDFAPEAIAFTPENVATVISELEQYRERLVSETLTAAQKAKVMKSTVMADLEPELAKIDAMLQELRDRQASLLASN